MRYFKINNVCDRIQDIVTCSISIIYDYIKQKTISECEQKYLITPIVFCKFIVLQTQANTSDVI